MRTTGSSFLKIVSLTGLSFKFGHMIASSRMMCLTNMDSHHDMDIVLDNFEHGKLNREKLISQHNR